MGLIMSVAFPLWCFAVSCSSLLSRERLEPAVASVGGASEEMSIGVGSLVFSLPGSCLIGVDAIVL